MQHGVHRLIERRNGDNWIIHVLWVLAYSAFLFLAFGSMGVEFRDIAAGKGILFLPLGLAAFQMAYPTLLGWAILNMPGTLYVLAGIGMVSGDLLAGGRGGEGFGFAVLFLCIVGAVQGVIACLGWPERIEAGTMDPAGGAKD